LGGRGAGGGSLDPKTHNSAQYNKQSNAPVAEIYLTVLFFLLHLIEIGVIQ
jgi:hypothetical protein